MKLARAAVLVALAAATSGACAPVPNGADAQPAVPPDPEVAAAAIRETAPTTAVQATFRWSLEEPSARFQGEGVARIEPPYRARIDLFGPRGEAYISAALVGDELRVPPGADPSLVPPVPLLWSALGVLRAPPDAALIRAVRADDGAEVAYGRGEGLWRFEVVGGNLVEAVWEGAGAGRHSVTLEPGSGTLPARATYRDWLAYRELTLELDTEEHVEGFDPAIWTPGGR